MKDSQTEMPKEIEELIRSGIVLEYVSKCGLCGHKLIGKTKKESEDKHKQHIKSCKTLKLLRLKQKLGLTDKEFEAACIIAGAMKKERRSKP